VDHTILFLGNPDLHHGLLGATNLPNNSLFSPYFHAKPPTWRDSALCGWTHI